MADLRLISIISGQPTQGVQLSQGAAGTGQGAALLAGLTPGTVLSGFIINRDLAGNPILRTPTGDVTFQSNFFLNIGSEVVIRIENTGGNTLAHILSVDGQPPEVAAAQSVFAQEPEVIVSQNLGAPTASVPAPTIPTSSAPAATVPLPTETLPTVTVNGTVVSTPPQTPSASAPVPIPVGTQVTLKLVNVSVPQSSPATTSISTPTQSSPTSYATYAKAAGTPVQQPAVTTNVAPPQTSPALPTAVPTVTTPAAIPTPPTPTTAVQTPGNVQIQAPVQPTAQPTTQTPAPVQTNATVATPPATTQAPLPTTPQATPVATPATPSAPVPLQSGQTVTATVISKEPTGAALVQTAAGHVIRLQTSAPLPAGSTVTFEVSQVTPPEDQTTLASANTLAATASTPAPITELARGWTTLQQIVSLLQARATAAGEDFVPANIPFIASLQAEAPQPNISLQTVPTALVFFIAALKGSDFTSWLGRDNVQWLRDQGHTDLVTKASAEFTTIARQFTEAQPGHWQPLFFPVVVGGELQQARLFVKRDRKQGSNQADRKNEDTRFVVEVDLSQLGEMQMDGFVRRRGDDVQFDMVIRSLMPLSEQMQQDILSIYNSAGEITGFKGGLAFQAVREFPVNPMEEVVAHGMKDVVA